MSKKEKLKFVTMKTFRELKKWDQDKYQGFIKERAKGLQEEMKPLGVKFDDYKVDADGLLAFNDEQLDKLYEAYFNCETKKLEWSDAARDEAREYCFNVSNIATFETDVAEAVVEDKKAEIIEMPTSDEDKMKVESETEGKVITEKLVDEVPEKEVEKKVEPAKERKPSGKSGAKKEKLIELIKKGLCTIAELRDYADCSSTRASRFMKEGAPVGIADKVEEVKDSKPKQYKLKKGVKL